MSLPDYCDQCGSDLTELSLTGRCPECGNLYDRHCKKGILMLRSDMERYGWFAAWGLMLFFIITAVCLFLAFFAMLRWEGMPWSLRNIVGGLGLLSAYMAISSYLNRNNGP